VKRLLTTNGDMLPERVAYRRFVVGVSKGADPRKHRNASM